MPKPAEIPLEQALAAGVSEPFVRTLARLAAESPEAPLLTSGDRTVSRAEFEALTNRMGRAYVERGVALGHFVTLALPNSVEWFVHFVACWKAGAIPQPVSPRLPLAERQAIVELAESRIVVGADPGEHPGRECVPASFTPSPGTPDGPLPELISPARSAPTSGGSTGRPKLIVSGSPAEGSPSFSEWIFGYEPGERQLICGPLYHNAPIAHAVGGLLLGHHMAVLPRFDAEVVLDTIERHRITWLFLVPTMMLRLHRLMEEQGARDLSSVRVLFHGASKCPDWLKEAWIDRLGAGTVYELYGGTEAQSLTVISGEEWLAHRGSVGQAAFGDMAVFGEDGTELPAGQVGEIYMRPPVSFGSTYRYVGAEARTRDGWDTLGDLGWKDEDGYLYISDRRVDMIVTGGENVYPAEVEAALEAHPHVTSAVVVGLPDDELGSRVHALVHAEPAVPVDELLEFVSQRLVRYKIPRSVELMEKPLRDDAGKARRSAMRDEAIARLASQPA